MSLFGSLKEELHKTYTQTVAALTGPLKETRFLQEGVLTPDEYVTAGDLLVFKCPTWAWAAGDSSKAVAFLPRDKQFLITRKVPCSLPFEDGDSTAASDDDGWLAMAASAAADEPILEMPEADANPNTGGGNGNLADDDDDVPDMEAFEEENLVEATPLAAPQQSAESTVLRTRSYDIALTYDNYYQTPKVWLVGYAATGQPLSAAEMMRDVSADHAGKTVTLAPHPHLGSAGGAWLWIHPCRHAQVMHKFVARMVAQGRTPRVDQYLLLFLKFLGAVLPTIQYDNTFEIDLAL